MVATDVPAAVSSGGTGGSLLSSPKLLGIGATAAVVISILTFWLLSGSDDQALEDEALATTTSAAEANPVFESEVVSPQEVGLNDLIDEAKLAATAGQVFNPPGSNAIELYLSALDVAPGDPVAEVGLQQVIEQALGMAETALLERRPEDAAAALQRVELANPENPRLPFLNAQLEQMQLRDNLDDARLAVRESRFEDAQLALSNASALAVPDTTEIDVVRNELNAALSEQHVDEVLAKANMRLDEGLLVAPSNDNARYYYELALSNDPDNNSALQGLNVVASKLVLQAREQIDAGNFQVADALLADARRLDPSSNGLSASTAALQTAREQRTQDVRRVAEQQAAAERAAAEQAAAEQAAAEQAAAEQAAAEQAALKQAAKQESTAEQATAVALVEDAPSADAEPELVAADAEPALTEPVDEPQAIEPQSAAAVTPAAQKPVPVSSLKRNKYVAPKYPRTAQRRSLSGWVDIVFTVDIDGTVSDIDVRDSNPGETFVDAASNAVEQWEFEPVIENGVAIQQRAAVRMMFAIE
jgi:TonB family protein